ncbi:MAG: DNA-methyltransferase [Pirellulales bacterium]
MRATIQAEGIEHELVNADCLGYLKATGRTWATTFSDPPDNLGLDYSSYSDKLPSGEYVERLAAWLDVFVHKSQTVWFSYNARWTFEVGAIVRELLVRYPRLEAKPCVQTFTFGQHRHEDLGNNHRPLLRLRWPDAYLNPEAIRIPSWRQEHGDARADPRGRVPGDVFDFPRVTGNSKQRRPWHPTQLHEGLVERCLKLTTPPGGTVLDPFGGTGTTLRVCKKLGFPCTLIEIDAAYCDEIAKDQATEGGELVDHQAEADALEASTAPPGPRGEGGQKSTKSEVCRPSRPSAHASVYPVETRF